MVNGPVYFGEHHVNLNGHPLWVYEIKSGDLKNRGEKKIAEKIRIGLYKVTENDTLIK